MEEYDKIVDNLRENLKDCEYVLIGIGAEWGKAKESDVKEAYRALYRLTEGKDYFIVTTVTDGRIFQSPLNAERITAPCGNVNWFQCRDACTKDIWEKDEIAAGLCPHCGAPLIGNTIEAEHYIEEGYLPGWNRYKEWLAGTLGHRLLVLELGEGFKTPTVIRWPFEKTVFFNRKAQMYRVNAKLAQVSEEIRERAVPVAVDSLEFIVKCADK
ncbi:hypothetical protein V3C10_03475 [[Clostridium] symbiosum]|uniref:hypothetical protein n=1 Tax=Clostridium symbiosum TaxID=1512 RepID=UPI001D079E81|nr:hypothetical protein [[Clostridium] symbiosum]MCB6611430.1 hypothetical protein [[Clostridium] symbiosum]MCB6932076.1 hypothetical protein [[Clostridium] symbiosum]